MPAPIGWVPDEAVHGVACYPTLMADLTEQILARFWQRAHSGHLATEGFIEDALVLALHAPDVWKQLVAHLGWNGLVPDSQPSITTQDRTENGRTDITLSWPEGRRLILELKIGEPPSTEQLDKYLQTGAQVATIAKLPTKLELSEASGSHWLGVVTWAQIRNLHLLQNPLPLRQLHALLDATGVVVPRLTLSMVQGMLASWGTWEVIGNWTFQGMKAVKRILHHAGFGCVFQEKPRERVRVDETHHRYVWWIWPAPWRDGFGIFGGLFMGRSPAQPVQIAGTPDLILALHLNPASDDAIRLIADPDFSVALTKWQNLPMTDLLREKGKPGWWEVLRVRTSSAQILDAPDQGQAMVNWMAARAQEWVDTGLIACLARLRQSLPMEEPSSHVDDTVQASSDSPEEANPHHLAPS